MGERKGTNLYYPPDYDPKMGGLNKFLGTHALRERARKIHLGILIIRFEMPYNIWCDGCGNHIGMGVRYNAEKKKVGMYYSTPVYQFRMKCHLCDNHFEIKTDPGNLDYVIISGARRQENRWDPTDNGQVVPEDKNTSKRLFDDAMFKLEHGKGDQTTGKSVDQGSRKLIARRDELWQDDFSANSLLRAKYRATKRAAAAKDAQDKSLLKKFSLDMNLLPEHESDVKMASLLSLKPSTSIVDRLKKTRSDIINRPVLPSSSPIPSMLTQNGNKTNYDLGITIRKKTLDSPSVSTGESTSEHSESIANSAANDSDSNKITREVNEIESFVSEEDERSTCSSNNRRKEIKVSLVSSLYNDSSSD